MSFSGHEQGPKAHHVQLKDSRAASLDRHVAQIVYRFARPVLTAQNLAEAGSSPVTSSTVTDRNKLTEWEREDENFHKYMLVREVHQRLEDMYGENIQQRLEKEPLDDVKKGNGYEDEMIQRIKSDSRYHQLREQLVEEIRSSVHRLSNGAFGPTQQFSGASDSHFSFQSTPSPTGSDARSEFSSLSLGNLPLPDEIIPLARTLKQSSDAERRHQALQTLLSFSASDIVSSSAWPDVCQAIYAALGDGVEEIASIALQAHADFFRAAAPAQTADVYLNIARHITAEWNADPSMMRQGVLDLDNPRIHYLLQRVRFLEQLLYIIPQHWRAYSYTTYESIFETTAELFALGLCEGEGIRALFPSKGQDKAPRDILVPPLALISIINPTCEWLYAWDKVASSREDLYRTLTQANVVAELVHTLQRSPVYQRTRKGQGAVARDLVELQSRSGNLAGIRPDSVVTFQDMRDSYLILALMIAGRFLVFAEGRQHLRSALSAKSSGHRRKSSKDKGASSSKSAAGDSDPIDECVSILVTYLSSGGTSDTGQGLEKVGVRARAIAAAHLRDIVFFAGRHVTFKEHHVIQLLAPILNQVEHDKAVSYDTPGGGNALPSISAQHTPLRFSQQQAFQSSEVEIWQLIFQQLCHILQHPETSEVALGDKGLDLIASSITEILTSTTVARQDSTGSPTSFPRPSASSYPTPIALAALQVVRALLSKPVWQMRLSPYGLHHTLAELATHVTTGSELEAAVYGCMSAFLHTVRGAELVVLTRLLDRCVAQIASEVEQGSMGRRTALLLLGNASVAVRDGLVTVCHQAHSLLSMLLCEFWELARDPNIIERLDSDGPAPAVIQDLRAFFLAPGSMSIFLHSPASRHTLWPMINSLALAGAPLFQSHVPCPTDAVQLGLRILSTILCDRDAEGQIASRYPLRNALRAQLVPHTRVSDGEGTGSGHKSRNKSRGSKQSQHRKHRHHDNGDDDDHDDDQDVDDDIDDDVDGDDDDGDGDGEDPIVVIDMNTLLVNRLVSRFDTPSTAILTASVTRSNASHASYPPVPSPVHIVPWQEPEGAIVMNLNSDVVLESSDSNITSNSNNHDKHDKIIATMTPSDDDEASSALQTYRQRLGELCSCRLPPRSCHDLAMTLLSLLPHCTGLANSYRAGTPSPNEPVFSLLAGPRSSSRAASAGKAPRWFARQPDVRQYGLQLCAGLAACADVVPTMDRDLFIEDLNGYLSSVEKILNIASRAEKMEVPPFPSTELPPDPYPELRLPAQKPLPDDCLELVFGFDYFAATLYLVMQEDAISLISALSDHAISIFLWPYRSIEYLPRRDSVLQAPRPLCTVANLVDVIINLQYPALWTCLTSAGVPPSRIALAWLTQCFWDTLPLDQITMYLAICVAFGLDYQVYFVVSLLEQLQGRLVRQHYSATDIIAITLEQPIDHFDLRLALARMVRLEAVHRDMCLNELNRVLPSHRGTASSTTPSEDRRLSIGREPSPAPVKSERKK